MKQLYYSFTYPYLITYAITSWGSACKTRLNRIRSKQHKGIRSIFLHTVERMLRLTIIYWISSNLITFSNLKQHSEHIKSLTIQQASQQYSLDCHSHYTRFVFNLNFHRPQINNNYGASTFSFIASKIWETIPQEFKKLCYYRFSKHFKLYLLNLQSVSQNILIQFTLV